MLAGTLRLQWKVVMSCCVGMGIIFSHGELLAEQTSFSRKGDKILRKMKCGCLHGGGHWKRSHAQWPSHSMYGLYLYLYLWEHVSGDPQCSAEDRYNNTNIWFTPHPIKTPPCTALRSAFPTMQGRGSDLPSGVQRRCRAGSAALYSGKTLGW